MRTIKQETINTAPTNKTIKLSTVAAEHLVKSNVEGILNELNITSLIDFAKNENNTLILGEMFGVPKEKLSKVILEETLDKLGVNNYQNVNDVIFQGNTVELGGFKKSA